MTEQDKLDAVSLGDGRCKCPCGYIYDPAKGDPKHDIPAGTKFEEGYFVENDSVAQLVGYDIFGEELYEGEDLSNIEKWL